DSLPCASRVGAPAGARPSRRAPRHRRGGAVRIAVLGNADALHTRRWATVLSGRGHVVRVFSLEPPPSATTGTRGAVPDADATLDVTVIPSWPVPRALRYPLARERMARALLEFAPDLVEAHFVPNYGFLAALVGRHPL